MVERVRAGMARAKANGKHVGRRREPVTDETIASMRICLFARQLATSEGRNPWWSWRITVHVFLDLDCTVVDRPRRPGVSNVSHGGQAAEAPRPTRKYLPPAGARESRTGTSARILRDLHDVLQREPAFKTVAAASYTTTSPTLHVDPTNLCHAALYRKCQHPVALPFRTTE